MDETCKRHGNRIGRHLLRQALLLSLILTLLFTAAQAWIDYRKRLAAIHETMEQVKKVQVEAIVTDLWTFDKDGLRAQTEGMLHFPYLNYAAVRNNDKVIVEAGVEKQQQVIAVELPLLREHNGRTVSLGALYFQADTTRVLHDVFDRIMLIFLFQAATVALVAFFLFMLFERLVTRHLSKAADYFRTFDVLGMNAPLQLDKKQSHDEIDTLAEAFNKMRENLAEAYSRQLTAQQKVKESEEAIRRLNAELEQRVRERTAQLETANKELEAFSYSVSHDLRAPLRHLKGFVGLLNKRAPEALDEKSRHYLTVISDSAVQMGKLIDDILSFSRMGRTEMMQERVSMENLFKEAMEIVEQDMNGRDITWTVGCLPTVYGDPAMLRMVLVNLVSNAIKFTAMKPYATIEIGHSSDEKEEIFYVKDNGAGFDMRYVDKLFGLFQRLHRASEFSGTGLGLANIRRIIHRHGGRTWAEGAVNEGAVFYFSLPKCEIGVS